MFICSFACQNKPAHGHHSTWRAALVAKGKLCWQDGAPLPPRRAHLLPPPRAPPGASPLGLPRATVFPSRSCGHAIMSRMHRRRATTDTAVPRVCKQRDRRLDARVGGITDGRPSRRLDDSESSPSHLVSHRKDARREAPASGAHPVERRAPLAQRTDLLLAHTPSCNPRSGVPSRVRGGSRAVADLPTFLSPRSVTVGSRGDAAAHQWTQGARQGARSTAPPFADERRACFDLGAERKAL